MKLWITISFLVSSALVAAPAAAEPAEITEAFMQSLVAGQAAAGFDALMEHSSIHEMKPREIELAKGQTLQSMQLYKKPTGYVYFYRATDTWQLLNFDFNDQLQNLE